MQTIRVHQFGASSVQQLEDISVPTPGVGQVVIRLHAVGVNPADWYVVNGDLAKAGEILDAIHSDKAGGKVLLIN